MFATKLTGFVRVVLLSLLASAVTPTAFAQDVKVPQSAAEHESKAQSYRQQATQFRASATEQKKMSAEYAKQHPATKAHFTAVKEDEAKLATPELVRYGVENAIEEEFIFPESVRSAN